MQEYKINNLNDTKKLAEKIADNLNIGQVITLEGTLGSGKTYFSGCLINHILKKYNLKEEQVVSPTFNIVKEYQTPEFSIYHFDLYRLKNQNELYELDIENAFENGISIIEWPEVARSIIYNVVLEISIEITGKDSRIFRVKNINN